MHIELNNPASQGTPHGMEYSRWAYTDPAGIVTAAMRHLSGVQFDTFVCRGISGILVAPLLARAMSKHFLIVRKPGELRHSCFEVEGTFGHSWVFVDDFISSGSTRRECFAAIQKIQNGPGKFIGTYEYALGPNDYYDHGGPAALGGRYVAFQEGQI